MVRNLAQSIHAYAVGVSYLRQYDDFEEVKNLFIDRDVIADDLWAGGTLTEEAAAELKEADDRLIEMLPWLNEQYPEVIAGNDDIPREYWWWHLDEGPQVREEAEKAKIA